LERANFHSVSDWCCGKERRPVSGAGEGGRGGEGPGSYVDLLVGPGHHGDEHVEQDGDVGDVEGAEDDVADDGGELVVEGLDVHRLAVADEEDGPEHGAEGEVEPGRERGRLVNVQRERRGEGATYLPKKSSALV